MNGRNQAQPARTSANGHAEGFAGDPIAVLEDDHELQLSLCSVLEEIADSLPHALDRRLTQTALGVLTVNWPAHVSLEEQCLFPLLRRRSDGDTTLKRMLERLQSEHAGDEDCACEIEATLGTIVAGDRIQNPEMLGFMLRGFFESQRRHIGWENAVLLPIARQRLIDDDLAEMRAWIAFNAHDQLIQRSQEMLARLERGAFG